jgi:hypothetical protein
MPIVIVKNSAPGQTARHGTCETLQREAEMEAKSIDQRSSQLSPPTSSSRPAAFSRNVRRPYGRSRLEHQRCWRPRGRIQSGGSLNLRGAMKPSPSLGALRQGRPECGGRVGFSRLGLGGLVVVLALVCSLLAAQQAFGYQLPPQVENEFNEIIDFNYRGSAIANQPVCDGVCHQLRSAETRPGTAATATRLHTDARQLRVATGVLPKLSIGRLTLKAAGPVSIVLLIGEATGLTSKLIELVFPSAGGSGSSYCLTCVQFVEFYPYPEPYSDWAGPSYPMHQGGVYAWGFSLGGARQVRQVPDGSGPACDGDPSISAEFHVLQGPSAGLRCSGTPVASQTGYLLPSEVHSRGPVRDYGGEPYDRKVASPGDPGRGTVAARTRSQLESGNYPELASKLEYELGVAGACDPVDPNVCNPDAARRHEQRCDLASGGTNADPAPELGTAFNEPAHYEVKTPFTRQTLDGGQAATAMKVGWTKPIPPPKYWDGWGWRHVEAKHGWRAADLAATQEALMTTPFPGARGRLTYIGPEYAQNGVLCQRVVVVASERLADLDEPEPKGIMTSYGALASPP